MNTTQNKNKLLLRTRLIIFISLLVLNTAFLILAPLYARAVNDIGFGFDYLPDILDAALLIVHLVSFFLCYAVSAYSIFNFSFSKTVPSMLIVGGMTLYKYGLNLILGWFVFDGIPTTAAEIRLSLLSVVSNTVLEIIQYVAVILIIYFTVRGSLAVYEIKRKQVEKLGESFELRECVFPFTSLYSKKNPLQRASLYVAIAISALQIGQLLIHDIFVGGVPSSAVDVIWMIAYYVGSLMLGILGYLLMLLVLMKLDAHDQKLKENE